MWLCPGVIGGVYVDDQDSYGTPCMYVPFWTDSDMYSQYPSRTQPPQYLQPHSGMEPPAQYSAPDRTPPRSLSPLPQSHNELRARLEAAGVAPDKIATVLLSQPAAHIQQPPPLPSRPLSSNSNDAVNQSILNYGQATMPIAQQGQSKIIFDVHNARWEEINGTVRCVVHILGPGTSMDQPSYTVVHMYTSQTYDNHQLQTFRNGQLFSTCYFFPQSNEIQIERASAPGLGSRFNPEANYWSSRSGTIGLGTMSWNYNFKDPQNPNNVVLRCATTGNNADGSKHVSLGADFEMCKVIWLDDATARSRIELPGSIFASCTQDQLDEMVSFAMVQLTREVAGLNQAQITASGQPGKKKDSISAKTWLEAAKLGMDIVSAVSGGN